MITEDYCSFEVSKLLKEKGFDEYSLKNYWSSDKELHDWKWELSYNKNSDGNRNTKDCAAPTQQMAMKWLREVHKVNIEIHYNRFGKNYKYLIIYKPEVLDDIRSLGVYFHYEEAVETALKYCLENLI